MDPRSLQVFPVEGILSQIDPVLDPSESARSPDRSGTHSHGCRREDGCWALKVLLVALGVAAVLVVPVALPSRIGIGEKRPSAASGHLTAQRFAEEKKAIDQCTLYPHLKFLRVLHNNLGHAGPDQGPEGLVLEAMGRIEGQSLRTFVIINATGKYHCPKNWKNGIAGNDGTVNIHSGSHVDLRFSFQDAATGQRLTIPNLALTFFDLDTGMFGKCAESISAIGYDKYILSQPNTQVLIQLSGGKTTFKATMHGTAADNPTDPIYLTKLQQERSVTLIYRKPEDVQITLAASAGIGPRFFTFVAKPSLMCSKTMQPGQRFPLSELDYFPPLDIPVEAEPNQTFQDWFVKDGEVVEAGHTLCTVIRSDRSARTYRAPLAGRVTIQDKLTTGTYISEALPERHILAFVTLPAWPALRRDPGDAPAQAKVGFRFSCWKVQHGDMVKKGQDLVELIYDKNQYVTLKSAKDGVVKAMQDNFRFGDPVERAIDRNLLLVGKFTKLKLNVGQEPVAVAAGMKFERWRAEVGDVLTVASPILEVRTADDGWHQIRAVRDGILVSRQEGLKWDMTVDEVMMDRTVAVIGKLPPLGVGTGESATNVRPGMRFLAYKVKKGDFVTTRTTIAIVSHPDGQVGDRSDAMKPIRAGIVRAIQKDLREGMSIDDTMQDLNLATIGKLVPLDIGLESMPVKVPSLTAVFLEWRVKTRDLVNKGDPIAVIRDSSGHRKVLESPKYGKVESRQDALTKGCNLGDVLEDRTVAVIGRFPAVQPWSSFLQTPVEAPRGAIFHGWYVEDGEQVSRGQPIAKVIMPWRRLQGGLHKLVAGPGENITAPDDGSISNLQPLELGMRIDDAIEGPTIATVNKSLPIMQIFAVLLCVFMWICFYGLFKTMKKPKPIYNHIIFDEDEMSDFEMAAEDGVPTREKKESQLKTSPHGLRLDFEDHRHLDHSTGRYTEQDYIRTYYAVHRPLGIIPHEPERKQAPIVVAGFTVNSYAKYLGVRLHSTLVGVNGHSVRGKDYETIEAELEKGLQEYELWPLRMHFQCPDGRVEPRKFTEHPLGMEFSNEAPIRVSKVLADSQAAKENVEVGWYIVQIGDLEVGRITNFKEVIGYLKEGVYPFTKGTREFPQAMS